MMVNNYGSTGDQLAMTWQKNDISLTYIFFKVKQIR
jgi:hypothetical protein